MSRFQDMARALEWPVAILALLVIPVLLIEERATSPEVRQAAVALNWIIWVTFCIEFLTRWAANRTAAFPRKAWFDLLLIVLTPPFGVPDAMQGIRSLRVLRLLRLFRAFGIATMGMRLIQRHFAKQRFHYIVMIALATVILGAIGVYGVESGENKSFRHFGDALWWAATTVTTVGYGDITPVTAEGRLIAVVLMVTGIGVIGVFTATVASFLFEQQGPRSNDESEVLARLDAIERRLDALHPPLRTNKGSAR